MGRRAGSSKWGRVLRDAVRHPGRTTASLAGALVLLLAFAVPYWRERGKYRALGRKLGINRGKILSRTYDSGGLSAGERGPELRVTALRRGSWENVLKGRVG